LRVESEFAARISAVNSLSTRNAAVDSTVQRVGSKTVFALHGAKARYYIVWITNLGRGNSADINEVTATG